MSATSERRCRTCGRIEFAHKLPWEGCAIFTPEERRREQRRGTGRDPYAGCPPESFRLAEMGEVDCYGHARSGSDRRQAVEPARSSSVEEGREETHGDLGSPARDGLGSCSRSSAGDSSARPTEGSRGEGVVGSLVERLAARWMAFAETYPSAGEIPVEDDARFFLRAIADEIDKHFPGDGATNEKDVIHWLRTEATHGRDAR